MIIAYRFTNEELENPCASFTAAAATRRCCANRVGVRLINLTVAHVLGGWLPRMPQSDNAGAATSRALNCPASYNQHSGQHGPTGLASPSRSIRRSAHGSTGSRNREGKHCRRGRRLRSRRLRGPRRRARRRDRGRPARGRRWRLRDRRGGGCGACPLERCPKPAGRSPGCRRPCAISTRSRPSSRATTRPLPHASYAAVQDATVLSSGAIRGTREPRRQRGLPFILAYRVRRVPTSRPCACCTRRDVGRTSCHDLSRAWNVPRLHLHSRLSP